MLLWGAGRQIVDGLRQLEGREISLVLAPLVVSAILYAAGLACFAAFWRRVALDMGGRLEPLESQRAYFASHLGKYLPGKAWVLLIRCGLTDSRATPATVVVASTFYETLAMMAAGSLMAVLTFVVAGTATKRAFGMALILFAGLAAFVQPRVFSRLAALGTLPFQRWGADPVKPITYATLLKAILYMAPGWGLVGLSLVAVAYGIGTTLTGFTAILLAVGSMALAIAGGFAILIVPAGLGVREWILMQTLSSTVDAGSAVLMAVVARVVNVVAELLVAGSLYLFAKQKAKNA